MQALWKAWHEVINGGNFADKTKAVKTRHFLGPQVTHLAHEAGLTDAEQFSKLYPYIKGEEESPKASQ